MWDDESGDTTGQGSHSHAHTYDEYYGDQAGTEQQGAGDQSVYDQTDHAPYEYRSHTDTVADSLQTLDISSNNVTPDDFGGSSQYYHNATSAGYDPSAAYYSQSADDHAKNH